MSNYQKHRSNAISLHESSIIINRLVNDSNKGLQTCEIIERLTYNVYIQPTTAKTKSHDQISPRNKLTASLDSIHSFDNELKQETPPPRNYLDGVSELDCDIKLVLLGAHDVGKTTLFNQKVYGQSNPTRVTLSAYFCKKCFTINDEIYEVAIWDTAGEEKFH
eukprot:UN07971